MIDGKDQVMHSVLLMMHVESNAGYAIDTLLPTFIKMAERLVTSSDCIHISFTKLAGTYLNRELEERANIIEFDPATNDKKHHAFISEYIRRNKIDAVFGFDQPVRQPAYKTLRNAGVKKIVSYMGAPASSLNTGIKLLLKRIEVGLMYLAPDHYIFESDYMARTAYQGRGIPGKRVSVVHLGVDTERYKPTVETTHYAHRVFDIPVDRKIIYYSGHMEERKGVAVLIRTAIYLYESCGRRDFHFLILGNREGEERRFKDMLGESGACRYVTFGGYRNDVEKILPSCFVGAIASTGWDSFTMSSLEISACGLPLLVSRLQGLIETIKEGSTGQTFTPGDHEDLARCIQVFLDVPATRDVMGASARQRVIKGYTRQIQVDNLVDVMNRVLREE